MNNRKLILSCAAAFLGIYALPEMMGFTGERIYLTNSICLVIAWVGLSVLLWKGMDRVVWGDLRENLIALSLALVFSVCMAIGSDLDSTEYLVFGDRKRIFCIVCFALALTVLLREVWSCMDSGETAVCGSRGVESGYSGKTFLAIVCLLLLCWLPVFLASYPGFFVYDAQDEVNQVLTRSFSSHHPLLHVLMLGGIVAAVHKVSGSYNLGIACYMAVQMCVAALSFAYMMNFLKRHRVYRGFRIAFLASIGLFPVFPMYVLCSSKDTLFSIALLLLILHLYELLTDTTGFFSSWRKPAGLVLSSFFMMSLRHNGVYAFLVLLVLMAFRAVRKRAEVKPAKIIGMFLLPVVLCGGATTLMTELLHASAGGKQEMLTVPIMQLTRVYETDADSFSNGEKELLYQYLPEEAMARYTPKLSDPVKVLFNNEKYGEDPLGFWRLWLGAGISHVGTYINAWLYTSYGFWYPDTIIDAYGGIQRHTFLYGESSYFGYETEPPGTRESRISCLDELYRRLSLEIAQQKIPVVSMLFSPGFWFWFYAFAFGFFLKRRQYSRALTFLIVLLLWLTVLLGPTCMVRYVLIFWFAYPVLGAMVFEKYTGFV